MIEPEDFYKIDKYFREMLISRGDYAEAIKKIEEQVGINQTAAYLEKIKEPYRGSVEALKQLGIEIGNL